MAPSHILLGASANPARPVVRHITPTDLLRALARGLDDFSAMPSHAVFLCLVYPLLGLWLISWASGYSMLPLAFPLAAGFALVGPLAAIGLYELSRRREAGLDTSSRHALEVLRSPSLGAIVVMGVLLMAIFLIWLAVAEAIYVSNFGYAAPASIRHFVEDVLTTTPGWRLIVVGTGVGLFAALVLTISAVSFPLLLDRDVGAAVALLTSIRVVLANPLTMALWGHRRRLIADRLVAVVPWSDGRHAGSRSRHLASLPYGRRAGSGVAARVSSPGPNTPLRGGFSRGFVPDPPPTMVFTSRGPLISVVGDVGAARWPLL